MLTAYLFGDRHGREIEDWAEAVDELKKDQVLWLDLLDASEEEEQAVRAAFHLADAERLRLSDEEIRAELKQGTTYNRVTSIAVSTDESNPTRETVAIECFMGENWVVTAHRRDVKAIEDFRALAEGGSELGVLDAPSFLATLFEWMVTSYSRAFDEIESTLEEFDISILDSADSDTDEEIARLVEVRARVGRLRRALAPHREVFAALAHPEFDLISTEVSADRFGKLTEEVDAALLAARDAKDAVVSSFDVLILRVGHRTNEIVKVLMLASILLLPGALLSTVLGMNVNSVSTLTHSTIFWCVIVAILSLAGATLALARGRRWI